jgi:hypothetical protein
MLGFASLEHASVAFSAATNATISLRFTASFVRTDLAMARALRLHFPLLRRHGPRSTMLGGGHCMPKAAKLDSLARQRSPMRDEADHAGGSSEVR